MVEIYVYKLQLHFTCSHPDSNLIQTWHADSKILNRPHMLCAHSLFNKNINLCAICSWEICLQLHFMCSCTAVARAHTQLPHDNRHWTCKWLPHDSIRILIVATDSIPNFRFAGPYYRPRCSVARSVEGPLPLEKRHCTL